MGHGQTGRDVLLRFRRSVGPDVPLESESTALSGETAGALLLGLDGMLIWTIINTFVTNEL